MAKETMQAAVLYGPEDVRMEQRPVPKAGPGEVLVRIKAALTCGTDAKVYLRGGHPTMIRPPAIFGHEFAGDVAEVGEGVEGFWPGMKVVSANSAPCNRCFHCKIGRQSMCEDVLYINGAYAEYLTIPARIVQQNLLEIPEGVPYEHAALVEPLSCAVHGAEESGIRVGDVVVVNGAGPIGLFFVQLAKLKGAWVVSSDVVAERLETAKSLGADEIVDASQVDDQVAAIRELTPDSRGADVVIEATGVPEVWEKSLLMGRKGAIINLFGGCKPGTSMTVDTKLLHYSELTIKGVYHHTPYYVRRALDLIAREQIDAEAFITRRLPLSRVAEALDMIVKHDGIKSAVIPEED